MPGCEPFTDTSCKVQSSVTIIVHNAWQLNFNLGLSSFEPHIRGTRRLIDFAFASVHATKMRLLFTSSVSVAQSWPQDRGPYPEEPQDDPQWAVGSGYGESKYVAERVSKLSIFLGILFM
jgi:nucleoside-diphosphate-sugar epimerase